MRQRYCYGRLRSLKNVKCTFSELGVYCVTCTVIKPKSTDYAYEILSYAGFLWLSPFSRFCSDILRLRITRRRYPRNFIKLPSTNSIADSYHGSVSAGCDQVDLRKTHKLDISASILSTSRFLSSRCQLKKRILLITGAPGTGKTTVLSKTVELLKAKSVSVGGMISREAKDSCSRLGFEVIDLNSGKHGWLAHVHQKTGPQVGKYKVNLTDLERIGVKAVTEATQKYDVVVIDEIGPMELFSAKFKQAVQAALESSKVVLAVVHAKAKDPLISEAKRLPGAELFTVTADNREGLPQMLAIKVLHGTSITQ